MTLTPIKCQEGSLSRTLPVKISVLAAIVVALLVGARLTVHLAAQAACFPFACFEPGTEGEVWQALVPVGHVNDQTLCVNSDRNDNNLPVQANRTCTDPTSGLQVPPPLGSFLYPYAIAVDGKTIFANDQFAITLVAETGVHARSGDVFDNRAIWISRFDADGKSERVWTVDLDHEALEAFWDRNPVRP